MTSKTFNTQYLRKASYNIKLEDTHVKRLEVTLCDDLSLPNCSRLHLQQ